MTVFAKKVTKRREKLKQRTSGKQKGRTRKWESHGVVDHTEDRTCQQLSYVGTSTLHPKYPKKVPGK
jgi:hypothetical protein